jgi:hypothetical protein
MDQVEKEKSKHTKKEAKSYAWEVNEINWCLAQTPECGNGNNKCIRKHWVILDKLSN